MAAYPIYGIYSPDAIRLVTWKGVEYIVMANEGDTKEYGSVWSEEKRGHDFTGRRNHEFVNINITHLSCHVTSGLTFTFRAVCCNTHLSWTHTRLLAGLSV